MIVIDYNRMIEVKGTWKYPVSTGGAKKHYDAKQCKDTEQYEVEAAVCC